MYIKATTRYNFTCIRITDYYQISKDNKCWRKCERKGNKFLQTVGESVDKFSHYGKQYGGF